MDRKLIQFISRQTCASICCVDEDGNPYCFNCFYACNAEAGLLYFKSATDTHHAKLLQKRTEVAGTILPDKLNRLQLKGVQFEGTLLHADDPLVVNSSAYYYKKYPVAKVIPGEIQIIQLNKIKFTDNTLGFATKIRWNRSEAND